MRKHDWVVRTPKIGVEVCFYEIGTPLLIDDLTGFICEPVLFFITEKYLAISRPYEIANSLNSYAHDLKDWWIFMDEFQLRWDSVRLHHLESYCSVMRATKSPFTGSVYATKTIKRRVSTILEFYKWAKLACIYKGDIEDDALINKSISVPKIKLQERASEKHLPSILNPPEAKALMAILGSLPSELDSDLTPSNCVFRLTSEVALNTGLRISEIIKLKSNQFIHFDHNVEDTKAYKIVVIGKGNKVRKVNFPGWLIKELKVYNDFWETFYRNNADSRPSNLFLNLTTSTQWSTKPLSIRSLQRRFNEACIEADFVYNNHTPQIGQFSYSNGLSSTRIDSKRVRFTFHDLRHSFAVWTYYSRKKYDNEPWLYIQAQLGHAFLETTIGTYLKCTLEFEAEITDAYMERLV